MKRILLSLIAVVTLLGLPATSFAASRYTDVTGVVYYQGKHVGKGVIVDVSCNGHVKTDKTNRRGVYFVQFKKTQCSDNSLITVTVNYDGHTGTTTGKATDKKRDCHLNVAVLPVTVVPEFGTIAAITAGLFGSGAFLVIRRRQLGDHRT